MAPLNAPPVAVDLKIERYAYGTEPDRYANDRGTMVTAETRFPSSRVYSNFFPTVWVSDGGDVDVDDGLRIPAEDAIVWLRAVADHIEARQDAS